jgi:hypothetical protein
MCSEDFKKRSFINNQILEVESAKSSNPRQPIPNNSKPTASSNKQNQAPITQITNPNEVKRSSKT